MENGELTVVDETSTTPISQFDMVDVKGASEYMDNYQELVEALLVDSDYQMIGSKKAKKKSAWRKLATAFKISDEIVTEQLIFDENDGQIVSARYKVKATLPNGRSTIGVGVCSIYDKIRYSATGKHPADTETPSHFILRGRFSNAEHDVPSIAHTRAKNRAIADLIGAGEVSAEELGDIEEPKKVSRTSRNGNSKTQSKPTNRRRNRKKAEPKPEEDVIEAKAEVVEETSDKFDGYADNNQALAKAIQRIRDGGDELTKNSIVEELYAIYDLDDITIDEYYEAKEALGL